MQCHALTVKGHPCRGNGIPHGYYKHIGLCHRHRTFFEGSTAYALITRQASIFQTIPERNWIIKMIRSPLFRWKQDYEDELLELMTGSPTRWTNVEKAAYIYDIFVQSGCINPLLISRIWLWRVKQQFRTLLYCTMNPTIPVDYRHLILHFLKPYFMNTKGVSTIVLLLELALRSDVHPEQQILNLWREILACLSTETKMDAFATYSIELFLKRVDDRHKGHPTSLWNTTDLRQWTKTLFDVVKVRERAKMKARIGPLKEELMARTWRPERIQAALDAGLELEDI